MPITHPTNGSNADVQAKINLASESDIVEIPVGTFTWTSGVLINKGIHLRGTGAGKILGRSVSQVTIGLGLKTFTVNAGLAITAGQTLRIWKTGGGIDPNSGSPLGTAPWVEGTVNSYSGTTLEMNITSSSGSGTLRPWHITTPATTTIVHNVGSAADLIAVSGTFSRSAEISGIRFEPGTGAGINLTLNPSGYPTMVHDCFFTIRGSGGSILARTNQGLVWNCYFVDRNWSRAPLAFQHKFYPMTTSWTTASTMGAADTTGAANFYFEDCWFVGFLNSTDFDDNSRTVMRKCHFDHSGVGTHGADTGDPAIGVRHYENYDNIFYFDVIGTETIPLVWWFYLRGGTGVIADNVMPNLSSSQWGSKLGVNMTIQNLGRVGSANGFGCWGFGIAGLQYPAPRQIGRGNPDGTAGNIDPKGIAPVGNLEPLYIWGNTGGFTVGTTDFGWDGGVSSCGISAADFASKVDPVSSYVVAGRDYYNNGTAKPGYAKKTYPHPMRSGSVPPPEPPPPPPPTVFPTITTHPSNATVTDNQPVTFSVAATGTAPLAYQWFKTGVSISGATSASYTIANAHAADAGLYKCRVTNSVGTADSTEATLTVNPAAPTSLPAGTAAFAAVASLSTNLRNTYTGFVGMQILTGNLSVTLNYLGRMMLSGNAAAHTVKVVRASTQIDVPGASVSLNMAGGTIGQFKYAALATPVVLLANTLYWIVTQETAAGDVWHDHASTVLIPNTAIATITALVWDRPLGGWTVQAVGANESFGPVNFGHLVAVPPPSTAFPLNPTIGQIHTIGNRRWKWNGTGWKRI